VVTLAFTEDVKAHYQIPLIIIHFVVSIPLPQKSMKWISMQHYFAALEKERFELYHIQMIKEVISLF